MYQLYQRWDGIVLSIELPDIQDGGGGLIGVPVKTALRRRSDGKWLGVSSWQTSYAEHAMVEPDQGNLPGYYEFAVPTARLASTEKSYDGVIKAEIPYVEDPAATYPFLLYLTITAIPGEGPPLLTFSPMSIGNVSLSDVGDDGGWFVESSGSFDTGMELEVWLEPEGEDPLPCYSGVVGQAGAIRSTDGASIQFVVPPAPVGSHAVTVKDASTGDAIGVGTISVVPRGHTTNLYELRRDFPLPRDIGAYSIDEEP